MIAEPLPSSTNTHTASRRAMLAGALGGIGLWAAALVGKASPVRGTQGQAVIAGQSNDATGTTMVTSTTQSISVLFGEATAAIGSGVGVRGDSAGPTGSGVWGNSSGSTGKGVHGANSDSGYGLYGTSWNGIAVYGASTNDVGLYARGWSTGVWGESDVANGVRGYSYGDSSAAIGGCSFGNNTGVSGYSAGVPVLPKAKPKTGVFGFAAQDSSSKGVFGESPAGRGIQGKTTTGYAGYFEGRVYTTKFYEMTEVTSPAAPASNRARLFIRDNGSGKTQLCVRFSTGALQVIATQP